MFSISPLPLSLGGKADVRTARACTAHCSGGWAAQCLAHWCFIASVFCGFKSWITFWWILPFPNVAFPVPWAPDNCKRQQNASFPLLWGNESFKIYNFKKPQTLLFYLEKRSISQKLIILLIIYNKFCKNVSELLNSLLSMIVQQLPVPQVFGCCQILQFLQKREKRVPCC